MKIVINTCYGGYGVSKIVENELGKSVYHTERHDPKLVELVEKYGKQANGLSADLEIVEIADGLNYKIDEYDGMESIETFLEVFENDLINGLTPEQISLAKQANNIRII